MAVTNDSGKAHRTSNPDAPVVIQVALNQPGVDSSHFSCWPRRNPGGDLESAGQNRQEGKANQTGALKREDAEAATWPYWTPRFRRCALRMTNYISVLTEDAG